MTTQVISTQAKDYKHRRATLEEISKFTKVADFPGQLKQTLNSYFFSVKITQNTF